MIYKIFFSLNSLPEVEREAIIAERYNKRKELKERYQLQKKLNKSSSHGIIYFFSKKFIFYIGREPRYKSSGNKANALSDLKSRRRAFIENGMNHSRSSYSEEAPSSEVWKILF